ncbi:NADH-quinone oxidoreductase subunit NuoI [Buchnera aphidicola (Thelaxes californica)]|uniref:NADH-quinone oxidoreductase subunit I n=1 Tax=Buchnera aphidicola (Thelaxes californica) TaxID=1315998 RepID=A0A4D6YJK7_9GAMM|nr:NADH-quinone oxidoreductase subunit NuoI [Buchnera aphidicola]QCI26681.1 NADH-quinone oxidoreductase subunit NuoI [Buchnera aphidicola (Thelaxes californica)]
MFFKKIFFGFFTQIRSLWLVSINLFSKKETKMYPDQPIPLSNRYRGKIILTLDPDGEERCVACNLCSAVCPVDCISLQKSTRKNGRWYAKFFRINFSRCIFCGLCEEACPTAAIQLIPDVELGEFNRKNLVYEKKDLLISGTGKNNKYNFYKVSGVKISDKQGEVNKDCFKIVDTKTLLP